MPDYVISARQSLGTVQLPGGSADSQLARAARDAAETARDEVSTNRGLVAADRVQTGLDAGSAATQAAAAAISAGTATTQAALSAASAAAALNSEIAAESSADAAAITETNVSAAAANAAVRRTTLAALNLVTGSPTGTVGEVYAEAANNGTYRWSGGAWDLVSRATIPSLATSAQQAVIDSGDIFAAGRTYHAAVISGGAALVTVNGRNLGVSIPALSTGLNSSVSAWWTPNAEQMARLVGQTIYISIDYTVTANFLAEKPPSALSKVVVSRTVGGTVYVGSVVSSVQVGTKLTRVLAYTVLAGDLTIGAFYQVTSASTANAHSMQVAGFRWWASLGADGVSPGNEAMAVERIATLRRRQVALFERADTTGVVSLGGGAVAVKDAAGRSIGYSVTSPNTGASAYLSHRWAVSAAVRAFLAGKTLRFFWGMTTTDGLSRTMSMVMNGQVGLVSGTRNPAFVALRTLQSGTTHLREYSTVAVGDEYDWRFYLQAPAGLTAPAAPESIQSAFFGVDIIAAPETARGVTLDELNDQLRALLIASVTLGMGPVLDQSTVSVLPNVNGATVRSVNGAPMGLNFPATLSGVGAYIQVVTPVTTASMVPLIGCTLTLRYIFDTTADFTRFPQMNFQVKTTAGTTVNRSATLLKNDRSPDSTSVRCIELSTVVVGDEVEIRPFFQQVANSPVAYDEWIVLRDVSAVVTAAPNTEVSLADHSLRFALRRAVEQGASQAIAAMRGYYRVVTVKTDGTGDYLTPQAALTAITDASAIRRTLIQVYPGIYDVAPGLTTKAYVDLEATDINRVWLQCHLPDSSSLAAIAAATGFNANTETTVRGFKITVQNARYGVHADSPSGAVNTNLLFEDCDIEHLGNQGAIDYQTSLGVGGNPAGVWGAVSAWGSGLASGQTFTLRRCALRSPQNAFFVHTNVSYARPARALLEDCTLIPTNAGQYSVMVQPLGDGQNSVLDLRRCVLGGPVAIQAYGNLSTDPKLQVANRANVRLSVSGCTPVAYVYNDSVARALRIESVSTGTGSSVALSGAAAVAMCGVVITDVSGGGLPGAAYGTWDVTAAGYTLGARLGDCTSVAKPLLVSVDGGAPLTVNFGGNHTADSNATILGLINAVLGAAATASLMDVTEGYRPHCPDDEMIIRNSTATTLRRKRAVAYADDGSGRVMTGADPAGRFAGVALEHIAPGALGRVKWRGVVRASVDLERTEAGALTYGATLGVSGSDGRLTLGAAVPLLTAINANDVTVG